MSTSSGSARSIRVERTIAGTPHQLWAMVADVTRMGDWSPENHGAEWIGGATGPALGARFKGTNSHGNKTWHTDCVIAVCEPGKRFGFDVKTKGFKVAAWLYEFEAVDGGCRVTESWEDHRGLIASKIGPLATGVKDRPARNRETMEATLEQLAGAVPAD